MLLRSPWRPVACPQPYEPYTFLKALFETRSESLYTCPGDQTTRVHVRLTGARLQAKSDVYTHLLRVRRASELIRARRTSRSRGCCCQLLCELCGCLRDRVLDSERTALTPQLSGGLHVERRIVALGRRRCGGRRRGRGRGRGELDQQVLIRVADGVL